MKKKSTLAIAMGAAIVLNSLVIPMAIADQNYHYICVSKTETRVISIEYDTPSQPVPCHVTYTRDGTGKVLWDATFDIGYCEKKADTLLAKQKNMGWLCELKVQDHRPQSIPPAKNNSDSRNTNHSTAGTE